jgi:4-hydroxy-tetrahydrodipicolinate synthase
MTTWKGTFTALVTPFKDGLVDYDAFEKMIETQISAGIEGLVPCGTTGESPTLSHDEHKKIIEFTVTKTAGRAKVLAGTGSNSTDETLELSQFAEKAGADGCLLVCPYYNKPSAQGLFLHFKKVADTVGIPHILYNVPGRTGIRIPSDVIAKLAEIKNIVGIKDATGDLSFASEVFEICGGRFAILSGNDDCTLPVISIGGVGTISVVSNIAPSSVKAMVDAALAGDYALAQKLHYEIWPLSKGLFAQTNPIPVKTAAYWMGLIPTEEMRLPLSPIEGADRQNLRKALQKAQMILVR